MEHRLEGGRGSSSSFDSFDAKCLSSSLSETITIFRISFLDSTRACFVHETSQRCIFNKIRKSLLKEVEILQSCLLVHYNE
jgi:hypothetical protein